MRSKEGTAKQPRDPRNGAIPLLQSRNSKCNVGLILAAKTPLGDGCLAAGARGSAIREGCGRELPAAWLCGAGDMQRGAGQMFASCLIKRVFKSQ